MDAGDIGIIIGIVSLGVTIICALGNSKLNKLCTQIERVEIKLKGELSRINSEINLLRGQIQIMPITSIMPIETSKTRLTSWRNTSDTS